MVAIHKAQAAGGADTCGGSELHAKLPGEKRRLLVHLQCFVSWASTGTFTATGHARLYQGGGSNDEAHCDLV